VSVNYVYSIDENNEIKVWSGTEIPDAPPFLLQPHRPDGEPWADRAEAEAWVSEYISGLEEAPTE
jgi:hypothetical protein